MENRVVRNQGTLAWAYAYAPDNKRVWRGNWSGGTQTVDEVTFWSVNGQKLASYGLYVYQLHPESAPELRGTQSAAYQYFGGKMIKNAGGWVTPDRLGSNGKFYPYGEERPSATTNGKEKFATYFRDSETGLDYAQNRYHDPGDGRFMTPDPFDGSANPADPGSWNRYAYVGGDPLNKNDPSGLASFEVSITLGGAKPWCAPDMFRCDEFGLLIPELAGESTSLLDIPNSKYFGELQGLVTEGILSSWSISDDFQSFTFNFAAPAATYVCALAPEVCVAAAGAGVAIYVLAVELPKVIEIVKAEARKLRLVRVQANCSVHQVGTPNHASAGTVTAQGTGVNYAAARAAAYAAAQAEVRLRFGVGFHAQHCNYREI